MAQLEVMSYIHKGNTKKERKKKNTEKIFKIMTENFLKLKSNTKSWIQQAQRTPRGIPASQTTSSISFQTTKIKDKEKHLEGPVWLNG